MHNGFRWWFQHTDSCFDWFGGGGGGVGLPRLSVALSFTLISLSGYDLVMRIQWDGNVVDFFSSFPPVLLSLQSTFRLPFWQIKSQAWDCLFAVLMQFDPLASTLLLCDWQFWWSRTLQISTFATILCSAVVFWIYNYMMFCIYEWWSLAEKKTKKQRNSELWHSCTNHCSVIAWWISNTGD